MYGGACYHVQAGQGDSAMTWREARAWCHDRQTELVSITSLHEQLFVHSLVRDVSLALSTVWSGPFQSCNDRQTELVSITSLHEQLFVHSLVRDVTLSTVW